MHPQCGLAQKYIETYGARAMVLVAPSAPDLGPSLRRLAPESDGLSGADFDQAVAAALRPGSAEDFARRWLLSPSGAEVPDALAVATHVTRAGGVNTRVSACLRPAGDAKPFVRRSIDGKGCVYVGRRASWAEVAVARVALLL